MARYEPQIIHLCAYVESTGDIYVEDNAGIAFSIPFEALKDILTSFSKSVRCVVLSAALSERVAVAFAQAIDCVIYVSGTLRDQSRINFISGFYAGLGAGQSVQNAYAAGRARVYMSSGIVADADLVQLMALRSNLSAINILSNDAEFPIDPPERLQDADTPKKSKPQFTGQQLKRIAQVLVDAYTRDDFKLLVRIALEQNLDDLVSDKAYRHQVFALIEWAHQRKVLKKLLWEAHEDLPTNQDLAALYAELFQE
jgi:hypothetical protein